MARAPRRGRGPDEDARRVRLGAASARRRRRRPGRRGDTRARRRERGRCDPRVGPTARDDVRVSRSVPVAARLARRRPRLASRRRRGVRARPPAPQGPQDRSMSERVLYLIRHGQSDFDSEEMLSTPRGEQFDPPLSALGREQAGKLAKRLLVMDAPAVVYSSTMRRTRETIAPYAAAAGVEVLEDADLIEAHIGEWERVAFRDILASDEGML